MSEQTLDNAYLRLIEIGKALSAERNLDSLLKHILQEAKSLASADAGTIYLASDKTHLKFAIVLLGSQKGAPSPNRVPKPMHLPDIPLYNERWFTKF